MKKILIIQTTLNETGNTNKIAEFAFEEMKKENNLEIEFLDLKQTNIELCNGGDLENYSKETQDLYKHIESFDGYILASPVYNYAVSGVCKNFLDIFTKAMSEKYIGLMESAGSTHHQKKPYNSFKDFVSYFKVNVLEFCPRATYKSFTNGKITDDLFLDEFSKLKSELIKLLSEHKTINPIEDN